MKKSLLLMLLVCAMAAMMLAGCDLLKEEEEKEVDKTQGVINLEGTYWIHDKLGMGYFFKNGVVEYVYMHELYREDYLLEEATGTVTIDGERKEYSVYDLKLHMKVNDVNVEFRTGNKQEFYALVGIEVEPDKESNTQPNKQPEQNGAEIENPTLEGTYWMNKAMLCGYYFKDGTADYISFGTRGSMEYTISGNEITLKAAGATPMICEISGSTLTIKSGGVEVKYDAVTKDMYEFYVIE